MPFGVDLALPQVGGSARKTNKDYTKVRFITIMITIMITIIIIRAIINNNYYLSNH